MLDLRGSDTGVIAMLCEEAAAVPGACMVRLKK
jgi:hypothetical protein